MLLSEDEIRELTGYKRPADQRRWLSNNGYRYAIGAAGKPKVAHQEALRHLVGGDSRQAANGPDYSQIP